MKVEVVTGKYFSGERYERHYVGNVKHGKATGWHLNGALCYIIYYHKGMAYGTESVWHDSSEFNYIKTWKDNLLNGVSVEFEYYGDEDRN